MILSTESKVSQPGVARWLSFDGYIVKPISNSLKFVSI